MMLRIEGLAKYFSGLKVLENVEFTVPEKTIFGLIGPNGAGKTTVFNLITGLLKPTRGEINFGHHALHTMEPHEITATGIARTFQNIRIFPEMDLLENVVVGMHRHLRYRPLDWLLRLPAYRQAEKHAKEKAFELLKWVDLDKKADWAAGSLSYGEQRKLELARALATEPKLLLLDEPVAGMNHGETEELMPVIHGINQRGYGVLLIEHDMKFVMGLCREVAVLNFGVLIAQGEPEAIRHDARVIEAYLGAEH